MDFCTLGMFIIDEIWYPPPKPPVLGIMGGAGSWAALGARLFRKPPSSVRVGWVVHRGSDFPRELEQEICSWQTRCNFITTPERLTTRGLNHYTNEEHREFMYLTPKIRVDQTVLASEHLKSKTYHLICSPRRCIELVQGILEKRKALALDGKLLLGTMGRPIFVWEPVPDLCVPSELLNCMEALKFVNVISPNLDEFAALCGVEIKLDQDSGHQILRSKCEEFLTIGFGCKPSAVVVRLGERGCYCAQSARHTYFPAFYGFSRKSDNIQIEEVQHESEKRKLESGKVVDPTGGGNAFLGGFCIGLVTEPHAGRLTAFEVACIYGSVAASFAIEQVGMPKLSYSERDGRELWNGESVDDRTSQFEMRLNVPPLTDEQQRSASLYDPAGDGANDGMMIREGSPAA